MEPKSIEISALGRPLYPGMLYDCRSDSFIPGVTLWDKESLNKDLDVRRHPKTDVKFCFSDSLNDKTSLLDVGASLKASFLSGLVEVGGSAKYLNDKKSSSRQSRVTMQYSQTTRFEQLTMSQLGKIVYPQVFEEKSATHVVTAVLYGGQAFLVFDQTATKNEDTQAIEGNLSVMVKKIPSFSIEGEGHLKMNENEKKQAEKISCTFHGDYEIEENPTSYMESLQLYKKLPSILKNRENDAVPVKVWLYPLVCLDTKAARLEREISAILISKTEGLMEELENAERACNDLVKNSIVCDFQDLIDRLKLFQGFLGEYKMLFQKAMCRLLPAIRGGEKKDEALADILFTHSKSPFTANRLKKWLENFKNEVNLLDSYTREMSGCPVVAFPGLIQIVLNPNVDEVICFSFSSLDQDLYLSSLTEYLKADEFEKLSALPKSNDHDVSGWLNDPDIGEKMKENFFLFKGFSEANKGNCKIRCVIATISDFSNRGTSIHLYRKGKMVDSKFQPVSKPPAPSVHIQNGNVVLKLQKSPTGATMKYRVEYRADSGAEVDTWKVIDTPDAEETFILTGLQLASKHWVRYRAVSVVGVSEASDSIDFFREEKINVPVAKSWNWTTSSLFNELRKKIIISLGISRCGQSTIRSEVTNLSYNLDIPYDGPIPGGLRPGMALYFQGVVPTDAKCFSINLMTGPTIWQDDVAFHFRPDIEGSVVCNSFRNGKWESQEILACPLTKGSGFDIFIIIKTEGYEVYVNGQKHSLFKHRMPIEGVTTLYIAEEVIMDTVGIVTNWSTSPFSKEMSSGTSRGRWSNIQSDVAYPLCNPRKTYESQIPGGLKPGLALFFQGVVASDCERFAIDLKTGQNEGKSTAFHFSYCISHVVCDSFRNGNWDKQYITEWSPFVNGGAFDLFMVVTPEGYEVIVNGQKFCMFNHPMPLDTVSAFGIWGEVFMNNFGIIEVDNVNLKVTIPGHV